MINNSRPSASRTTVKSHRTIEVSQVTFVKVGENKINQSAGPANASFGNTLVSQSNPPFNQLSGPVSNKPPRPLNRPNPPFNQLSGPVSNPPFNQLSRPVSNQNPLAQLLQLLISLLTPKPKPKPEPKPAEPTLAKPAAPKAPAGPKGSNEAFAKRLEDTGRSDFTVDGQKYAVVKSDSDSGFSAKKVNDDGSLGKTIDKNVQGPDSDLGVKGFFEVGGIKGVSGKNRAYIGNSDPSGQVKVIEAEAGLDKGHKHREAHSDIVMKSGKELNGGAVALPNASKGAAHALDNWTAFETAIQGDRNKADNFLGKNDLQKILDDATFSAEDKAAAKELLVLANTTGKNGFTKDEVAKLQKAGPVAKPAPLTEAQALDKLIADLDKISGGDGKLSKQDLLNVAKNGGPLAEVAQKLADGFDTFKFASIDPGADAWSNLTKNDLIALKDALGG